MCDLETSHDRQTFAHDMTYRPWQMTGRPMHDLEALEMSNQ